MRRFKKAHEHFAETLPPRDRNRRSKFEPFTLYTHTKQTSQTIQNQTTQFRYSISKIKQVYFSFSWNRPRHKYINTAEGYTEPTDLIGNTRYFCYFFLLASLIMFHLRINAGNQRQLQRDGGMGKKNESPPPSIVIFAIP